MPRLQSTDRVEILSNHCAYLPLNEQRLVNISADIHCERE